MDFAVNLDSTLIKFDLQSELPLTKGKYFYLDKFGGSVVYKEKSLCMLNPIRCNQKGVVCLILRLASQLPQINIQTSNVQLISSNYCERCLSTSTGV